MPFKIKSLLYFTILFQIIVFSSAESIPREALSFFLQGCYYSCYEDHDKAIVLFEESASAIPDNDYLRLKKAKSLINLKKIDQAYKLLLSLNEKNSVYAAEADIILASIALMNRENLTAASFLNHAMSLSEKDSNIFTAVSNLYEQIGMRSEAINVNKKALELFPGNSFFCKKLGELYLNEKKYPEAETYFIKALKLYSDDLSSLTNISVALDRQGKYQEKLTYLKQAIALDPLNDELVHEVIKTCSHLEKWDEAFNSSLDYIAMHPNKVYPLTQYAMLALMSGQPAKAIPVLESALEKFSQSAEINFFLGRLYHGNKQFKEAEKSYLAAISLAEEKAVIRYYYALLLNDTERIGNARMHLEDAVAEKPLFPQALNLLAYILAEEGKELNQALTYIERALKIEPENPAYLDSLGWILYRKGKSAEAMIYIEEALKLAPQNKEIKKHLETIRQNL